MLKGISPLLTPELLPLLQRMGHDEFILFADANFTAHRCAGSQAPVITIPVPMLAMMKAVLTVFPLVADETQPVGFMHVSGQSPDYESACQREVLNLCRAHFLPDQSVEPIERYAFYERAKGAHAIVVTGELQPYANFILRKGVISENLTA